MTLWWPRHLFGVRIKGAGAPGPAELREVAAESAMWALRHQRFSYSGQDTVAGRKADRFKLEPIVPMPYLFTNETAFDRATALPVEVTLTDQGKEWYRMAFKELTVNEPVDDRRFSTRLPANAVVFEWDLDAPGKTVKEMQRLMNFTLLVPTELPEGLAVQKIARGRHDLPMAVILMGKGGVQLSLTENRRAGALRKETGVPVDIGGNKGYLNFLGLYSSITWQQGNTALTLIGNLPYPEMLAVAASVKKPE
jgi:hypothetical protein